MMKTQSHPKIWAAAGAGIALALSAAIIALFASLTGWPNSLVTLGITLVVAWFVGAGIGGKASKSSWAAIAATALVVGLAASSLTLGVPWKLGPAAAQPEVRFQYSATFTYVSSESGLPIDNIAIRFPFPNVDNDANVLAHRGNLVLFWRDSDNVLHPEIVMNGNGQILHVIGYHEPRKENLRVLLVGTERSPYGPKLIITVDRLYPREGLMVLDNVTSPIELAPRVTLKEIGENKTSASYQELPPKVEPIHLSFWTELKRKINGTYAPIETFSRNYENGNSAWYWLFPT